MMIVYQDWTLIGRLSIYSRGRWEEVVEGVLGSSESIV